MVDWTKKFKAEYDYARSWLAKPENFVKEWQPLVKRLHKLMGNEGLAAGEAAALSELRSKAKKDGRRRPAFQEGHRGSRHPRSGECLV